MDILRNVMDAPTKKRKIEDEPSYTTHDEASNTESLHEPHRNYILPKFWTGTNAVAQSLFEIDCTEIDLTQKLSPDFNQNVIDTYNAHGVVLLTHTGLGEQVLEYATKVIDLIINKRVVYTGGANPRSAISPNFYDVGVPLVAHLHYHHEMVYVKTSPSKLAFAAKYTVGSKGATYLAANIPTTDFILSTDFGKKLKEKGICYIRKLTDQDAYMHESEDTVYNHWQKSFLCETPEEAEKLARERGLVTEWGVDPRGKGRYMITKYYCSAFEYCPSLDRNVLYGSIADDHAWFDTWPGVMEMAPDDRPLKLTFGDDSELTVEEKQLWVDAYDKFGIKVDWKQGDIAVVCNYRFAHGRPGIYLEDGEQRELGVILGDIFLRENDRPDKW